MKEKTFIEKIFSNPIVQTIVIYVSGGWIVLEITEYLIAHFGLNENARNILLIIMISLLPVAIFLSWFIYRRQKAFEKDRISDSKNGELAKSEKGVKKFIYSLRKPRIYFPFLIILFALLITFFVRMNHKTKVRWAKEVVIPEIKNLLDQSTHDNRLAAFSLTKEIRNFLQDDPEFIELQARSSFKASVYTNPSGAKIYIRNYNDFNKDWELLGVSPIDSVMISRTWHRWKIEKPGYETIYRVDNTISDTIYLDTAGSIPEGMVKIPGGSIEDIGYLQDFYIDRYEVTNREFKEFVDNGGYQSKKYWIHAFIKDGVVLTWEEAMSVFKDITGRNGPSTWYAGDYPKDQDDYPITGISWYEAAAYAEYKGKSLPTTYHWNKAAKLEDLNVRNWYPSFIIPLSNFGGKGPMPGDSLTDISAYGTFQMAGNASEWCWNNTIQGRSLRGGAWNSPHYMYHNISQKPAFDRSPQNGFRCAVYLSEKNIPEKAFDSIPTSILRNFFLEESVSNEIFQVYKDMFYYDNTELNPVIEYSDSSNPDWIKEKITYNAVYQNDRITSYLFLPKGYEPPYPVIIYITPSLGPNLSSETQLWGLGVFNFMIKNGYAVIHPVYYGDYERYTDDTQWGPHETTQYFLKYVKDFRRTIDYLEIRPDINKNKIGSYGVSRGASTSGIIINSVEDRLKMTILIQGGLRYKDQPRPEVDGFNYVTRIEIPTLMMNGKYDMIFPIETSVKPMFELLGTPAEDKKLVLSDSDHDIPEPELIRESLIWLDKYLGPTKREINY